MSGKNAIVTFNDIALRRVERIVTVDVGRYEVDPSYFAEKYSMPVGERRNAQPMLPGGSDDDGDEGNNEPQDDDDKKKKQLQNAHGSFFD